MRQLVLLFLIFSNRCWGAYAAEPIRPDYKDISVKVYEGNVSEAFVWYRGKVAQQPERDAMQDQAHAVAVPEVIRVLRTYPECSQALGYTISNVSKIWSKLNTGYEDNSLLSKIWEIGPQGRHYSFPEYIFLKARDCMVTSKVAPKCAVDPLVSTDFKDLLNIKVVSAKCVKGADFVPAPHVETYVETYARQFPVHIKTPQKLLTVAQHDLLHKTHEAHMAVTKWRCGLAPQPAAGIVDVAHKAFEASAVDKEQLHFFMMKRFGGFVDPKLPVGYECQLGKLQDKFHEQWMEAVGHADRATAWKTSRIAEGMHQLSHIMMNVYEPKALFQFACGLKRVLDCPVWDYETSYANMAKNL